MQMAMVDRQDGEQSPLLPVGCQSDKRTRNEKIKQPF